MSSGPPPFDIPAAHFLAGLLWLGLAAAGLVLIAPDLARGNILLPHVLATTHAFTLGFLTTIVFGALHQLFPAILGVGMRSARVARVGFWLLEAGILELVAGLWFWLPYLQAIGWILIFAAVGVVSWNLLPQRRRATQGKLVGRYISGGHSAFGFAMLLGLARIGESAGWWHFDRLGTIAAHYHLGALGFVTLTAVGVSSRILPMFLASDDPPTWQLKWIGPVAALGLVLFTPAAILAWPVVRLVGGLLLAVSALFYLWLARGYFRRRTQPVDPALGHVAMSLGFLGITILVGLVLLLLPHGFHPEWWAAYALVGLVGWLVLFTVGVLYRILAFLSWLHVFGGRQIAGRPIEVGDLTRRRWAWSSLVVWTAGVLTAAAGLWLGNPGVAQVGAVLIAGGVALVLAQVVRAGLMLRLAQR